LIKVGIAGVGGIGSNVAVQLVRAGYTSLKLVDFDRVELSNMNRQFYFNHQIGGYKVDMLRDNLLGIVPDGKVETERVRLTAKNMQGMFNDCQVLVEGLDEEQSKKLLVETFADRDIPIVSASGIAGRRMDTIRTCRLGNCTIVGDFQTDFRSHILYGPKVAVIAAIMADLVIKQGGCND